MAKHSLANRERAPLVVLLGADGSGKSSVAAQLGVLYARRYGSVQYFHWRPGFLPYRAKRSDGKAADYSMPHARRARSGVVGLSLFVYILADFVLGYYIVVRPYLRAGTPVIYERYYYDLMLDQARYALAVPQWLRNLGARFVKTPDQTTYLDGPASVLRARKAELSEMEIERQRVAMNTHLRQIRGFVALDVSRSSAEEVAAEIYSRFEEYTAKSCDS